MKDSTVRCGGNLSSLWRKVKYYRLVLRAVWRIVKLRWQHRTKILCLNYPNNLSAG
ncbi:MAG: hypothetical protein AB1757_19865 [Acidobacteriota bacterium]